MHVNYINIILNVRIQYQSLQEQDDSGYIDVDEPEFPKPSDLYDYVLQRPRGASDVQKSTQKPIRFLKRAPNTYTEDEINQALPPLPSQAVEMYEEPLPSQAMEIYEPLPSQDSVYEDMDEPPKHSSHSGVLKVTKKFKVRKF